MNQQPLNLIKIEGAQTSPYSMIKFETKQSQPQQFLKEIGKYVYNLNEMIGTGEFSQVYKGYDQGTNEVVAIKVIERKSVQNNSIFRTLLGNEINILRENNYKSMLRLYDYYETVNNIYIVTEFCADGDLQSIIKKKGYIPEHNAVKILKHLIKALLYLKGKRIIHRDIKSPNILVSNQIPKLADFGFAIDQTQPQTKDVLQVGTPLYMAPEVFYTYQYSTKTDLWALGIVFYEMLTGNVPFDAQNKKELDKMYQLHQKHPYLPFDKAPQKITEQAQDFIMSILVIDPNQRFDIAQAANHPLIQCKALFNQKKPIHKPSSNHNNDKVITKNNLIILKYFIIAFQKQIFTQKLEIFFFLILQFIVIYLKSFLFWTFFTLKLGILLISFTKKATLGTLLKTIVFVEYLSQLQLMQQFDDLRLIINIQKFLNFAFSYFDTTKTCNLTSSSVSL